MDYEVTIGIPLYNAERFIRQTLESALAQTFGSIEFLLVDDCGTDSSADIVREMQATHPRGGDIRIVRQPHNVGVGATRNRLIDEARGRYIYFMDSDDLISPDTIALLHEAVVKAEAEIAFGSYERIMDDDGTRRTEVYGYPDMTLDGDGELAAFAFRRYGGIQAPVWNCLIRLDFLRSTGVRFIDASFWEDMVFTYMLVTYVSRAVLLSAVTYHYICRGDSLSNFQRRELIDRSEVLANVATVDHLKRYTARLTDKPYLGGWCCNVVMTDFYVVCSALKNRDIISPRLTAAELRSFMAHPLSFGAILRLRTHRGTNLFLYLLGKLPPGLFVRIVKLLGKRKGLI